MEYLFYFLILVITISVIAGFAQSVLYPYVKVPTDELPQAVLQELENWQPRLIVTQAKVQKIRQRYVLDARQHQHSMEVTIQLTPDQEFANSVSRRIFDQEESLVVTQPIANGQVPPQIGQVVQNWVGQDDLHLDQSRAFRGVLGNEHAYRIEFSSDDFEYRFEITEHGQITHLSKKHLHR